MTFFSDSVFWYLIPVLILNWVASLVWRFSCSSFYAVSLIGRVWSLKMSPRCHELQTKCRPKGMEVSVLSARWTEVLALVTVIWQARFTTSTFCVREVHTCPHTLYGRYRLQCFIRLLALKEDAVVPPLYIFAEQSVWLYSLIVKYVQIADMLCCL